MNGPTAPGDTAVEGPHQSRLAEQLLKYKEQKQPELDAHLLMSMTCAPTSSGDEDGLPVAGRPAPLRRHVAVTVGILHVRVLVCWHCDVSDAYLR